MALWGNSDNVTSTGTVSLTYATGEVVGSGTSFSTDLKVGQVIRFGTRGGGIYLGDAVITGITSEVVLTIGSTSGLSGAAIASTDFTVSECPSYAVGDVKYTEASAGTDDSFIYGLSTAASADYGDVSTAYRIDGEGWVGVTTYVDTHGELRVKKEVLVAMSGITTGNLVYPTSV
jgi:hypothetical protein